MKNKLEAKREVLQQNRAKKLLSWFTDWRMRRQYSQFLQIKYTELTLQALELEVLSLREEMKENHAIRKLSRRKRGYIV